jgi:phenylpyruvate tautomerase PptA (4-oxalocrotonate tautomerase family)
MVDLAFKAAFLAHAPDADPRKHRCVIETGKYKLFVVVVKSQDEALKECKNLVEKEGIHAIMLCPGFTHKAIAEIVETVGDKVSVNVARGDGPSTRIAIEVMQREGWFQGR